MKRRLSLLLCYLMLGSVAEPAFVYAAEPITKEEAGDKKNTSGDVREESEEPVKKESSEEMVTDFTTAEPSALETSGDYVLNGKTLVSYTGKNQTVSIPKSLGITKIGKNAFAHNGYVRKITIPGTVKTIEAEAFASCWNLTDITVPASVTTIKDGAFGHCSSLKSIKVASGNKTFSSVSGILFNQKKTKLINYPAGKTGSSYTIPKTVKTIGDFAFSGAEKLKTIKVPETVSSLGKGAFAWCRSLTKVNIPKSYKKIPDYLLRGCDSLKTISIPSKVTSIGQYALSDTGITKLSIPSGVTTIEEGAFKWCENLKSISIPVTVTNIGHSAFRWCESLKSITLPPRLTKVSGDLFYGCLGLISVKIPNKVTKIEGGAFVYCNSLSQVIFPASVKSVGEDVFWNADKLKSVKVLNNNIKFDKDTFRSYNDLSGITLYGAKGSTTQAFAKANNMKFTALSAAELKKLASVKKPSAVKAASASYNSIKVSWGVIDADGYEVYRSTSKNSGYKKITSTTKTTYTSKNLKTKKKYYFKVRAYNTVNGSKVYSANSSTVSKAPVQAVPGTVKAKAGGKTSIKVSWKKSSGASGYEIYRSVSKNGKYKKIAAAKSSKTSYTDKKLKNGTKYFYKVRAYKTVKGKKVYSSFSSVKQAKTKK